ncbi:hypothetical protein HYW39_02820 [Candidatus Curtissbacteria bacterium]|nr:hypothetical protein [Candidatus Curtissbacteria bacterium]
MSLRYYNAGNMSEVSPSGAIGAPVGAGVSVAGAPSVAGGGFAESGMGGVGFDNGSPTFSGLERIDVKTGSFSVNEGPKGPVSFTNSSDLFAENKNLGSPSFSSPQPEVDVEAVVHDYLETAQAVEVSPEVIKQVVEEQRTSDPLVYQQLKSDLESVDKILDLVDQVSADAQTTTIISNSAIETAVHRSGLIKTIEVTTQEPDTETQAEAETKASDQTQAQAESVVEMEAETERQTQTKSETETDVQTSPEEEVEVVNLRTDIRPRQQTKKEKKEVRDEEANSARIENRNEALIEAFAQDADPETGKVDGKDVLARVNASDKEQSKLAKKVGVDDGSIPEGDKIIENTVFESPEQGVAVIKQATNDNTERQKSNRR